MIIIFHKAKATRCFVKAVEAHDKSFDLSTSARFQHGPLSGNSGKSSLGEQLMYLLLGSVE